MTTWWYVASQPVGGSCDVLHPALLALINAYSSAGSLDRKTLMAFADDTVTRSVAGGEIIVRQDDPAQQVRLNDLEASCPCYDVSAVSMIARPSSLIVLCSNVWRVSPLPHT